MLIGRDSLSTLHRIHDNHPITETGNTISLTEDTVMTDHYLLLLLFIVILFTIWSTAFKY